MTPFTHVCLDSWTPHRDSEAPADFCRKIVQKLQYKREAICVLFAFWKWFDRCAQNTDAGVEFPSEMNEIVLPMFQCVRHAVASVSLGRVY